MKKITLLFLTMSLALTSCSSSDDDGGSNVPEFAMTAKINNATFEANNPFGSNMFSETNIWSYFPIEDYVLLQGRVGGPFGNPEINLWLKRSQIAVGTYPIGQETFNTPPSHFIDLIDNSNEVSEHTKNGTIIITEVNTSTKIVKGTFQFNCVDELDNSSAPINFAVTEGTFRYKYEE